MDLETLLKYLQQGGLPIAIILILYGGYKKLWVWGHQLDDKQKEIEELKRDRDEWKAFALRSVDLVNRATSVASVTQQQAVGSGR